MLFLGSPALAPAGERAPPSSQLLDCLWRGHACWIYFFDANPINTHLSIKLENITIMQRSVSWHDKHTNAGTYTKSLRIDAGREKLVPSYTGALCKYRKILFHLGSTRSLRHCKGRLVHSTLNPRGRTVDSHAPRSFRRRQQKVLGYLTPRGNPNIVGNRLLIEHCVGTQDAKRPSPVCSR